MRVPRLKFSNLVLLSVMLGGVAVIGGCAVALKGGNQSQSPSPSISLALTPNSAAVQLGQMQQFSVVVQNDPQNRGVTWGLTQSAAPCSPGCGSLTTTANLAVYTAPSSMPKSPSVILVVTSVADASKTASAEISLSGQTSGAISVSISPSTAVVPPNQSQQFEAQVQNDSQNKGVVWSLTQSGVACSPTCGSIVGYTTQTAIYVAPSSVPSSPVAVITATSIADNTQTAVAAVTIASPTSSGGSSGGIDITTYGARSVSPEPLAAAICTAGSNVVMLTSDGLPTPFENGDSIRLDRCGPPTAMTPPTGVVVSPGMNAGGTPALSGLNLGNSSYSYQVIACDKLGGCSAASEVATTSSGASVLGRVTAPVLSMSLSDNVMTVTTTLPHNFSKNALVYIPYFSTQTPQFEGWYIITNVPSPNVFTFLTSIDSRIQGTPTRDTSGTTAVAFNCNVVNWQSVANAWKYFILGRNSTSMALIGVAEPGVTTWQDYGATMMGHFSFPTFVPTTPPNQPTNQYLLTTISAGGGTTTLTLAAPANNSIENVSARMGSDAAIAAAFKAATNGVLTIPQGTFQIAGYLDVHSNGPIVVNQVGNLNIADTIAVPGQLNWEGSGPGAETSFQESPTPFITGDYGSYPTVYITGGGLEFDHTTFRSFAANGILLLYADSGTEFNFNYVTFTTSSGSSFGYMQRQLIFRSGGFDYNFSNCLFIADRGPTGNVSDIGTEFLPSVLFVPNSAGIPSGGFHFMSTWFVGKSAVEQNASNSPYGVPGVEFDTTRTEEETLPTFITSDYPSSNTQNNGVYFYGYSPADYPSAMTGNWAAITLSVGLQNLSNGPLGGRPLFVGNPTVLVGQNGGTASSGPTGGGWFATGGSQVGYLLPPPASPPLLTISAGGNVPVGNHNYQIAWIDAFGNSTTAGPSATVNITSGMQTVIVTPPDAPAGAIGWEYYRDGALTGPQSLVCGPFNLGSSVTDALGFPACGNSVPGQNLALSSGMGVNGVETTQIDLTGGGFTSTISGIFTADRQLKVPDTSGTITVTIASGAVLMPTVSIDPGTCGTTVKATATGVLTSDIVSFGPESTQQSDGTSLKIKASPAADSVSFQYCNEGETSTTPVPLTLNWHVVR